MFDQSGGRIQDLFHQHRQVVRLGRRRASSATVAAVSTVAGAATAAWRLCSHRRGRLASGGCCCWRLDDGNCDSRAAGSRRLHPCHLAAPGRAHGEQSRRQRGPASRSGGCLAALGRAHRQQSRRQRGCLVDAAAGGAAGATTAAASCPAEHAPAAGASSGAGAAPLRVTCRKKSSQCPHPPHTESPATKENMIYCIACHLTQLQPAHSATSASV